MVIVVQKTKYTDTIELSFRDSTPFVRIKAIIFVII